MRLFLNEELSTLPAHGVFDSFEYLSSRSNIFGRLVGNGYSGSFYIKKYFKIFKVLIFSSFHTENNFNLEKFQSEFVAVIKSNLPNIDIISQGQSAALFPTIPESAVGIPFGSYVVSLELSEEIIFKRIHEKHRNVIRSAEKKGIQIFCEKSDLEAGYMLIQQVYKNQGLDFYSLNYFLDLQQKMNDVFQIWTAKNQSSEIQAVAFIFQDQQKAYYLHGGTQKGSANGAANLLHWKAILNYKSMGLKYYDFLGARLNVEPGSKLEGIQKFKERFGGELIQGFIWRAPLHQLKFNVFYFLLRLKSWFSGRGFFADTIDQELHKWK